MSTPVITLPDLDLVRDVAIPVRTDEGAEDGRLATMEVRFSKFGSWYEINSWWEGRFLERTKRGSFRKTIDENGSRVKVMFNHGFDMYIDQKLLGAIDSLSEERDSPLGVVSLFDTSYNRDLLPGLRAGAYGSSFMFRVIKDEWDQEPGVSDHNPEGIPERTITEVRLLEFGPVTWPANPEATAGIRSGTDAYLDALRTRDPNRVDALRSRLTSFRTPEPDRAAPALDEPDRAAPEPTAEPAESHSTGMTPAQRREALYPYLRGVPS